MTPAARTKAASAPAAAEVSDVLIIGAGISGINAGYRIQENFPNYTYSILETRDNMGGTWDFFRYPGIRSDSDLQTFGFPWRPWTMRKDIAPGDDIRHYIRESAAMYGIDKRIRYRHKVRSANWSSKLNEWQLEVEVDGVPQTMHTRFVLFCTGYYDYDHPLESSIKDLNNFKGTVVHPQFWPEDLDYTGKKVSIIGSGATAITLLPVLAEKAKKVTMIQRSPGYIISLPSVSPISSVLNFLLPAYIAYKIIRVQNIIVPWIFFNFCRTFPNAARVILRLRTKMMLPKNYPLDPHFKPRYNPWEQRLCVCPDADFFQALSTGKADIATGTIEGISASKITVRGCRASEPDAPKDGKAVIDSDIVITATGLKLRIAGGVNLSVDGKKVELPDKFLWNGVMLEDIPNFAITIGYTNASWTLGANAATLQVCRILKLMESKGARTIVPRVSNEERETMTEELALNLNSTYIQANKHLLPKAGDLWPWKGRISYWTDMWQVKFGNIRKGLQLV